MLVRRALVLVVVIAFLRALELFFSEQAVLERVEQAQHLAVCILRALQRALHPAVRLAPDVDE